MFFGEIFICGVDDEAIANSSGCRAKGIIIAPSPSSTHRGEHAVPRPLLIWRLRKEEASCADIRLASKRNRDRRHFPVLKPNGRTGVGDFIESAGVAADEIR